MRVDLTGTLGRFITAKDVALGLIAAIGAGGGAIIGGATGMGAGTGALIGAGVGAGTGAVTAH